ncbi:cytochrome P450 [Marasmius fiardii PR-910]|nr:cytochrome P450 [Marasmius fiardii PR-910]
MDPLTRPRHGHALKVATVFNVNPELDHSDFLCPFTMIISTLTHRDLLSPLYLVIPVILAIIHRVFFCIKKKNPYPPGPAGLPIIGNLFQAPKLRQWVKFLEWSKKYGPIFHLTVGSQHVVVLNTVEAVDDLFVRQSRVFSERYAPHVAADILSAGQRLIFINGSTEEFKVRVVTIYFTVDRSRLHRRAQVVRKAFHSAMSATTSRKFRLLQDLESRMTLYHLFVLGRDDNANTTIQEGRSNADTPQRHWYSVINRLSTNIAVMIVYGIRLPQVFGSERMHSIHQVTENVTHMALPGAYLADIFPVLRWIPDFLAWWRVEAKRLHVWESNLYESFLTDIISDHKNGTDRPECFVGNYVKKRSEHGLEDAPGKGLASNGWLRDKLLAYAAGQILEAASDTTAGTLKNALLLLVNHPEILRKTREELDAVVGDDRLPSFEDENSLPYLVAVIKEVMRCRPAIPLAIPHSPSEDVVYKGYFIPKGSVVIGNVYALHMDPIRFPQPRSFKPERWFVDSGSQKDKRETGLKLHTPMRWGGGPDLDRDHYAFGWGRRFCPGNHIAEASLFISLSRYIWAFDFQHPPDSSFPNAWDEESYTDGFSTNPHKFDISFVPRTAKHEEVIRRSFEEGQEQWETLGMERDRV